MRAPAPRLTSSLAVACLGRDLLPRERAAIDAALAEATTGAARPVPAPTLPQVVEALLDPSTDAALALRTTRATLMEDGRDVALELRRLVHGDLCGMFDGPTTPGLRLDGPLVVLDLSAVYHSPALGVLMACASGVAAERASLARHRNRIIVVVDEAWAILSNLGVARWLQSSWKLSRASAWPTSPCSTGCPTCDRWGGQGSEQVEPGRGPAGRLGDPGRLRPVPRGGGRAPASSSGSPRPRPSWSPSCAGAWPCGRWAGGRSWSSTAWRRGAVADRHRRRPWSGRGPTGGPRPDDLGVGAG